MGGGVKLSDISDVGAECVEILRQERQPQDDNVLDDCARETALRLGRPPLHRINARRARFIVAYKCGIQKAA